MSKYFKIVSKDLRFSKMLSLSLSENGLTEISDTFPECDKKDKYIIADVDLCDSMTLEGFSEIATVVGFSKEQEGKNPFCAVTYNRPFHMSDFLAFFGESEKPKAYIPEKRKESHKKPHFLSVDENSLSALWGDQKIPLSENEYKVLKLLCENRGEMVSRESIDKLLGVTDGNMGDVYICHLRRKIDNKLGLKLIYTIRGKGYMLKN